jgi:hypothetical protein
MNWKSSQNKSLMIGLTFKYTSYKHSQLTSTILELKRSVHGRFELKLPLPAISGTKNWPSRRKRAPTVYEVVNIFPPTRAPRTDKRNEHKYI